VNRALLMLSEGRSIAEVARRLRVSRTSLYRALSKSAEDRETPK
jgi:DNA-binding phage protein